MTHGSPQRLRVSLFALTALVTLAALLAGATPAVAATEPTITIRGRGWGHGHGMGQWGALGYAVTYGSTWQQILDHYYSNTAWGSLPEGASISVSLTAMGDAPTIVQRQDGGLQTSATGSTQAAAWMVKPVAGGYEVYSRGTCAAATDPSWSLQTTVAASEVRVFNPVDQNATIHHSQLIQTCEPYGTRHWYRGDVRARRNGSGGHRTINVVPMEQYLRGVVPRESPAGWGDAGGGRGMNALRAQAVAARSYAEAENRNSSSYAADTCDTASCQVYGGAWRDGYGDPGGFKKMEEPNTDNAVSDTRNVVRIWPGSGAVARTEFSSSTGGWTLAREFPSVEDVGDAYAGNVNHTWQSQLKVSAIEARYPQIGRYSSMQVTRRNGIGPDGGRVEEIVIRGSNGSVTRTGNQFRSDFSGMSSCASTTGTQVCIKSDWFTPVTAPAAGVAGSSAGYWVARQDGAVQAYGLAGWYGDMGGLSLNQPIIGIAGQPDGSGYWLVGSDGGIFAFDAPFRGSTGSIRLNQPVVGMASSRTGQGYWMVARDGGIFAYGDAGFFGSMGGRHLNQPVVGMARSASGNGYLLVASDGGLFAFGDAAFYGSMGGAPLNSPIVGMAPAPDGRGYWMVARDGGVFAFGSAGFHGSLAGTGADVVGLSPTPSGDGYWIVTRDGSIHAFGGAL